MTYLTHPNPSILLTVPQIALLFDVDEGHIERWLDNGLPYHHRWNGPPLIDPRELRGWLKELSEGEGVFLDAPRVFGNRRGN